jgi:hypothetical protein
MEDDLFERVQTELKARKGEWKLIARAVPSASYSWISQVGRGKYASMPTYDRLRAVAEYLFKEAA